jgi:hypothetical protein
MTEESTTTKPAAWTCTNCGANRPAEPHAGWCPTADAEPHKAADRRYRITLDAIEPSELQFGVGVQITVAALPFGGGFGALLVTLEAASFDLLLEYVRTHWGTEDETELDWRSEIKAVVA